MTATVLGMLQQKVFVVAVAGVLQTATGHKFDFLPGCAVCARMRTIFSSPFELL